MWLMETETLTVQSHKKREIIDLTEAVNAKIRAGKIRNGVCVIFSQHTTTAVTVGEMEEGLVQDFLEFIEKIVPQMEFRHTHQPDHAPDHLIGELIGPSLTIPIVGGKLALGTWQRVIFVELDGPRERTVSISLIS